MAANGCAAVELSEINFDIEEDGCISFSCLKPDAWIIADNPIVCTIRNYFKEFLTAQHIQPDGVTAVFMSPQSPQDQTTFSLQPYKAWPPKDGMSVSFTASVNNEMWYMSCTENKDITFKKGPCPTRISGDRSDVIFIFKDFSRSHDNSFKFESSLHRSYYLAIEGKNSRLTLKLVRPTDEVDETIKYTVNRV